MSTLHKLIAFDRPLSSAVVRGNEARRYTESDLAAARAEGYRQGCDATRGFADQQLVEFRTEVQQLQEGLFQKLSSLDSDISTQLQTALPTLAVELARRLLAGHEPDAPQVRTLCEETLSQLYPEHENLELFISPRDAALLDNLPPDWKARYPGLRITADAMLTTGDCQVRSRFGLTDARRQAKLTTLSQELLTA